MSNIRIFCLMAGGAFIPVLMMFWVMANTPATFDMYGKAAILSLVLAAWTVGLWGK